MTGVRRAACLSPSTYVTPTAPSSARTARGGTIAPSSSASAAEPLGERSAPHSAPATNPPAWARLSMPEPRLVPMYRLRRKICAGGRAGWGLGRGAQIRAVCSLKDSGRQALGSATIRGRGAYLADVCDNRVRVSAKTLPVAKRKGDGASHHAEDGAGCADTHAPQRAEGEARQVAADAREHIQQRGPRRAVRRLDERTDAVQREEVGCEMHPAAVEEDGRDEPVPLTAVEYRHVDARARVHRRRARL